MTVTAGRRDAVDRTRSAYFRAAVTTYFGGVDWYFCFVALGDVPAEVITVIDRPRRETAGKRVLQERTGVRHTVSDPKATREKAKLEAKRLTALEARYAGRWVPGWDWVLERAANPPPTAHCADYRVPVVLRELGVLQYAPALAAAVDSRRELAPGSQEEVEIRAATVVSSAVRVMRQR